MAGYGVLELPQRGTEVLFVKGEAMAQVSGSGGMAGGGNCAEAGESACCAAASNVLPVSVTGSHPPPFQ